MTPELERTLVLSRHANAHAIHSLLAMLPPPPTDDPAARVHRDSAAVAQLAGMVPVNADETALAVTVAAATACAGEALRLAHQPGADQSRCFAWCVSMLRQANGARSLLLRTQAVRVKRDKDQKAADAAAWTEHYALNDMLSAMGRKPNGEPAGAAEDAETSAACSETESRSTGNETAMRLDGSLPSASNTPEIGRLSASCSETKSRSSGNETATRLDGLPPSASDTPETEEPSASCSETKSRSSGNETTMRQKAPLSAAEAPATAAPAASGVRRQ